MRVEITLSDLIVEQIDELVSKGIHQSRSEFIRTAVIKQLENTPDDDLQMTDEEKEFWKQTLEILNKDRTMIKGRYFYYKSTFNDRITPSQFQDLYDEHKKRGVTDEVQ